MAFQALLEAGDHHVGAVDVLQRMPLGALVYYLSFYREAVCNCYNFVLFYFHILSTKIYLIECQGGSQFGAAAAGVIAGREQARPQI